MDKQYEEMVKKAFFEELEKIAVLEHGISRLAVGGVIRGKQALGGILRRVKGYGLRNPKSEKAMKDIWETVNREQVKRGVSMVDKVQGKMGKGGDIVESKVKSLVPGKNPVSKFVGKAAGGVAGNIIKSPITGTAAEIATGPFMGAGAAVMSQIEKARKPMVNITNKILGI